MTLHPDEQAREWLAKRCGARWIPINDEVRELSALLVNARMEALEEAAALALRWSDGWKQRIADGMYQGEMLQAADIRRDEGLDIWRAIRSLRQAAGEGTK